MTGYVLKGASGFANHSVDVVRLGGTLVTSPHPSIYRIILQRSIRAMEFGEADDLFASLYDVTSLVMPVGTPPIEERALIRCFTLESGKDLGSFAWTRALFPRVLCVLSLFFAAPASTHAVTMQVAPGRCGIG